MMPLWRKCRNCWKWQKEISENSTQLGAVLYWRRWRDLICILLMAKLWFRLVEPSRATVPRTVAFNLSNLLCVNTVPIKSTALWRYFLMVDLRRFELPTPTMRMWCAPSCATSPSNTTNYTRGVFVCQVTSVLPIRPCLFSFWGGVCHLPWDNQWG